MITSQRHRRRTSQFGPAEPVFLADASVNEAALTAAWDAANSGRRQVLVVEHLSPLQRRQLLTMMQERVLETGGQMLNLGTSPINWQAATASLLGLSLRTSATETERHVKTLLQRLGLSYVQYCPLLQYLLQQRSSGCSELPLSAADHSWLRREAIVAWLQILQLLAQQQAHFVYLVAEEPMNDETRRILDTLHQLDIEIPARLLWLLLAAPAR